MEPTQQPGSASDQGALPEEVRQLYEGAREVQRPGKRLVTHRFVERRQAEVLQKATKDLYVYEKVVEVPEIIVKEVEKRVVKPQVVERVIENGIPWNYCGRRPVGMEEELSIADGLCGTGAGGAAGADGLGSGIGGVGGGVGGVGGGGLAYGSGYLSGYGFLEGASRDMERVEYQERLVEVPQIRYDDKIVYKPKKVIEERVIIVPKVQYIETIEYEDVHEYREVPIDRIVEMPPEIEYVIKEIECPVTQAFYQDQIVDTKYTDVKITQVQEVERQETAVAGAVGSVYGTVNPPCPCCARPWPTQFPGGMDTAVMA